MRQALVKKLAKASMTLAEEIHIQKRMAACGMDSLVFVEMREWLTDEVAANTLDPESIASSLLAGLVESIIQKCTLVGNDSNRVHRWRCPIGDIHDGQIVRRVPV